jgi:hypothetical protein
MDNRRIFFPAAIAALLAVTALLSACGARQIRIDKAKFANLDPKQACLIAAYTDLTSGTLPRVEYFLKINEHSQNFEFVDGQPYILAPVPVGANFKLDAFRLGDKKLVDTMNANPTKNGREIGEILGTFYTGTVAQWSSGSVVKYTYIVGKLVGDERESSDALKKDVDLSILGGICKGGFIWVGEFANHDYKSPAGKTRDFKKIENAIVREEALKNIKQSLAGTAWESLVPEK